VHPFWSSHKEKRACVRFSMGGGHGKTCSWKAAMGNSPDRGKRGKEEGRGGGFGAARGAMEGLLGVPWGCSSLCSCVLCLCYAMLCVR
jgi:hypothetical protein